MNEKDKERFIEVAEDLKEQYVNFTKEQLEQHEQFKLEAEREAGIEIGLAQGIEQGIERKTVEHVKNMLNKNYDMNEIIDITGLTKEEIMKIKNTL